MTEKFVFECFSGLIASVKDLPQNTQTFVVALAAQSCFSSVGTNLAGRNLDDITNIVMCFQGVTKDMQNPSYDIRQLVQTAEHCHTEMESNKKEVESYVAACQGVKFCKETTTAEKPRPGNLPDSSYVWRGRSVTRSQYMRKKYNQRKSSSGSDRKVKPNQVKPKPMEENKFVKKYVSDPSPERCYGMSAYPMEDGMCWLGESCSDCKSSGFDYPAIKSDVCKFEESDRQLSSAEFEDEPRDKVFSPEESAKRLVFKRLHAEERERARRVANTPAALEAKRRLDLLFEAAKSRTIEDKQYKNEPRTAESDTSDSDDESEEEEEGLEIQKRKPWLGLF